MRTLLRTVATVSWGLWFGGMIALLIFVIRLFAASRDTGLVGAPVLFRSFAIYQLIVGAVALAAMVALTYQSRSKLLTVATTLIALSFIAAIPIWSVTGRLDRMRQAGQSQSDEFKHLHHLSEVAYAGSAISLLLAGLLVTIEPVQTAQSLPLTPDNLPCETGTTDQPVPPASSTAG
jgi:hypothetical protein